MTVLDRRLEVLTWGANSLVELVQDERSNLETKSAWRWRANCAHIVASETQKPSPGLAGMLSIKSKKFNTRICTGKYV